MKTYDAVPTPLLRATNLTRSFDVAAITDTIQRALASAGLDTQCGPIKGVNDTIQKALSGAGLNVGSIAPQSPGTTFEGAYSEVDTSRRDINDASLPSADVVEPAHSGQFVSRSFTNHAGTRAYKLYVPAGYATEPMPLVVMLHGCTQSPDDFAAGTQMNALAEQHGFLVVYPAQAVNANGSKCWNWFRAQDQHRDSGEPALIAGITREVAENYRVDQRRILVAGLSAGAAMAVILGATYPELYAAVGAHSGLPYGAAQDMPSAFAAMKGGGTLSGMVNLPGAQAVRRAPLPQAVPTIVFHGDRDQTVDARNGSAIVEQAASGRSEELRLRTSVQQGTASSGRTYTRTVYADAAHRPVVEQWVLHGGGHAWSGGSATGSFTDGSGPDASAEMVRFFYSQQLAGSA